MTCIRCDIIDRSTRRREETSRMHPFMVSNRFSVTLTVVAVLLYMATCVNAHPLGKKDANSESLDNAEPIGERQKTILASFQRLLTQRNVSPNQSQNAVESSISDDEDDDSNIFKKYMTSEDPIVKGRITRLLDDYQRNLDWYRNSRILKRDTLVSNDKNLESLLEDGSTSSSSSSPTSSHHRRSGSRGHHGRRHSLRHSRKRFRVKEKVDRSGWGGAYG